MNDSTLTAPVPGSSSSYHRMVAPITGECPHLVTTPAKFTGQFKCDGKCAMYAAYKVCSHTVAAAEVNQKLTQFVQWLVKQNMTPNLTNLSMVGIPKGAGKKGGEPKNTRKRKRGVTIPVQKKVSIDRLSGSTPSSTASDSVASPGAATCLIVPSTSSMTVHGQQFNLQGSSAWLPGNYVSPMPFHSLHQFVILWPPHSLPYQPTQCIHLPCKLTQAPSLTRQCSQLNLWSPCTLSL